MSKYTPGPWRATEKNVYADETDDRLGMHCRLYGGNRQDNRANARLISAAPDLLEALQDLLDLAVGHDLPCSDPERIAAREAIAKALGTTEDAR